MHFACHHSFRCNAHGAAWACAVCGAASRAGMRQLVASTSDKLSFGRQHHGAIGVARSLRIRAVIDIPERLRPLFLAL
jgi:hypothetical protein